MSESTTEAATTEGAETQSESADKPLGENGEKALRAEREARKALETKATELQKQLDAINAANMSDLEKAQKAAADAQSEADKARAEAARFRVAAKHGLSDEDAELYLTGSDADTLERQAIGLVNRTPTSPKPDRSQGARGGDTATTTADQFTATFDAMLNS